MRPTLIETKDLKTDHRRAIMAHPSYSYLDPSTLRMALDLARELHQASVDVSTLAFGEGSGLAMGVFGRAGDRLVAARNWIGPHRNTFDQLMDNEHDSARTTVRRLVDEAGEWARFWARATNARIQRLHEEDMQAFSNGMGRYQDKVDRMNETIAADPEMIMFLTAPTPPTRPTRPPFVTAPTAANGYRPTR